MGFLNIKITSVINHYCWNSWLVSMDATLAAAKIASVPPSPQSGFICILEDWKCPGILFGPGKNPGFF